MKKLYSPQAQLIVYLESNGFSGCKPVLDQNGSLIYYNHWSRFVVKQIHTKLRHKRSFTRHDSISEKRDPGGNRLPNHNVPLHGPQSIQHGWEWYEMGFLVHWRPDNTTILCLDLPEPLQASIQSALSSSTDEIDFSDPYSFFSILLHEVLSLYDSSVWSLRNHICEWEARRPQEPDYSLLHEIARHMIHVSETLAVALESVKDLQQQQQGFLAGIGQGNRSWNKTYSSFQFQLRILQSLLSRSESNKARLQNEIALVWWIAPLPLELAAAKAMLDEDYGDISIDGYNYYGGKIGQHDVVMAVQPKIGTDAASDLAARMRVAFRNIVYFLVVGIGGGVPSYGPSGAQHQIVLGDVVVSVPRGQYGGVVRYDFGAWTEEGRLETKGHTNGPPGPLLAAVRSLETDHFGSETKIPVFLQEMRKKIHIDQRPRFYDQGAGNDRLFHENYTHRYEFQDKDCESYCDVHQSRARQDRGIAANRPMDTPQIHYGTIGSSNQLQISATKRNECQKEHGVICFEMEGAGVIQTHPCLVIRGICDYSDSHKNKKWQPYAAATAAAYTKELLWKLPAAFAASAKNSKNRPAHWRFQV
ncbi:purine and uridine phosphorylase [Lepidopterella palustris CBS 459.81]|uniref:Purine and uridine phosphorylase n=1 Tax=Lepidopterella palustris CBS 459.81 TaxID=1314670 RepID=A0A8E2ECH7_9PEZI|nr:purine and uridine phosphorylase [Lepidopterella palustris CBS 459.81]